MFSGRPRLAVRRRRKVVVVLAVSIALALSGLGIGSASASTKSWLALSLNPDRSNAVRLDGSTVKGQIYVFVRDSATLDKVDFYLDSRWRTKLPVRTDTEPPFDLAGSAAAGTALPYDTKQLADGSHSLKVILTRSDGTTSSGRANFTVANGAATTPTTAPTATTTIAPTPAATTTAPATTTSPTPTPTATTATATPTTTPPPSGDCTNPVWTTSGNDDMRLFNGSWVHNNLWNPVAGASQTLSVCSERSWKVVASNFPDNNYEVFSYPNVHLDLPNWPNGVPLSNFTRVSSTFAGTPLEKGHYNVSYDIWVNKVGWQCGATEVMIWTETRPVTLNPLGSDRGDYTAPDGSVYDVWRYNDGCMNVVSYKSRTTQRSGTMNIRALLLDGVSRSFIPANPNLAAIDYGIEYRYTAGTTQFTVSDFSVTLA
jgi:hypothetical protein